ncbi:MAG: alcohol dehydrogenase catalytic domain-containing protein, partial [Actinobacteria bacterium]|nr:alcohol dehydrogenase catalytic domain-containing protein [Actinomycetota bacterium]
MKAAIFKEPYKVEITNIKIPKIRSDEALVKVIYAGICGTDIDIYKNEAHFEVKYPQIGGHEWAGIVADIGKEVKLLKVGDKVVGDGVVSCNDCANCVYGDYSHCLNVKSVGTSKPSVDGAFKEYMILPERHLFKIPEGVKMMDAALAEPAGVAARSFDQIGLHPGEVVFVSGTGAIGYFSIQYARLMGAQLVIFSGRNDKKLEIGKKYSGADFTINVRKENLFERVKELLQDEKINLAVEASGNLQALVDILEIIGSFGRITIPGSYTCKTAEIDLSIFPAKEIRWIFINGLGGAEMFNKILKLMHTERLNTRGLVTEIYYKS